MQSNKKISFGFSKLSKKPTLLQNNPTEKKEVELIECLEGQTIKIKDAEEVVQEPLVIPIKDDKRNLLDRVKEAKAKRLEVRKETEHIDTRPDSELTLDELAARELLNDAKRRLEQKETSRKVFTLPVTEEHISLEGEKEPTLEDYENVPISDFGYAILRGMGWKEGMGIGKNPSKIAKADAPELRPKGLGLGASKLVKQEIPNKTVCDEGKDLIIKRGTFAKIIAGSHKGLYCEIQGLDDESGRVIVKTSPQSEIISVNELFLVPVIKDEYKRGSKILNNAKYEEFKKKIDEKLNYSHKTESTIKQEVNSSRSSSEDRSYKSERKEHHNSKSKYKRNSSDSESKRKKQHKRKDKKSRKDKSRSPPRKQHNSKRDRHRSQKGSSSDSDYDKMKSSNSRK